MHVHPDFFGNAPQKILETNQQSVQEVNEYFQQLKAFQDPKGVEGKTVKFYIKSETKQFEKFSFDMLGLKDGSSPDMKQKHYETVIESMMQALNSTLDQS